MSRKRRASDGDAGPKAGARGDLSTLDEEELDRLFRQQRRCISQRAQHWHALKEQKQEKMDELALSLRTFLFRSMLDALLQWLQDTIKDTEQLKTAMTLQVFLPKEEASELMIPFLQFDQETKTLAVQGPFHSTQKFQGPTVPFLLQIGSRTPEATGPHLHLRSMTQSAIWQLVGGSLRPERMGRSALAVELAKLLQGPLSQLSQFLASCASVIVPITVMQTSLVCSFCWAEQLLPPPQVIWNQAMRTVMQRMCFQVPSADLWDSLQWTLMHGHWRLPHHQHDAAQYLGYCRRFIIPGLLQGRWQNRLLVQDEGPAHCQVRDCGDAWPILLATPLAGLASRVRGDVTIQRLIHAWQAQAVDGLTALESAPRMMVVQLNRFCSGTEPSKDTTPIVPDPRMLIPCFQHPPVPNASALQVRSHQYQLCAIISHTGVRPTEGHYRAILCSFAAGQSRSGSSSSSAEAKQFWYCDDDKSPQVLNLLTDTVLSEGYLYLYYRL
eukprot:s952_g3.t2